MFSCTVSVEDIWFHKLSSTVSFQNVWFHMFGSTVSVEKYQNACFLTLRSPCLGRYRWFDEFSSIRSALNVQLRCVQVVRVRCVVAPVVRKREI